MTTPSLAPMDRSMELVIDRALYGLTDAERSEFERECAGRSFDAIDDLDLSAGALCVAIIGDEARTPLPESVGRRVRTAASAWDAARAHRPQPTRSARPTGGTRFTGAMGWFVAAACLAFAVLNRPAAQPPPTPAERYGAIVNGYNALARDPGAVRVKWTSTDDPAAAGGVTGEVRWSDARNEGYMHITGLAANDPSVEQYQLWIFDADRDDRYPVDGGVFDIPAGGDVIIPITAKVHVDQAALFAVTVEKPGGVVVSSRERLPILAKVEKG